MFVKSEEPLRYCVQQPGVIYFAHGRESGPWGSKIRALAGLAVRRGYRVESPDYSDSADPDTRVERLLSLSSGKKIDVLAGSSMGGYVSTVASSILKPKGLFLMAPAFYIPGYAVQEPQPVAGHTVVVHGWNDNVVPVQHSIRFAGTCKSQLHLLESDHRLNDQIEMLCVLFGDLLDRLEPAAKKFGRF